MKEDIDPLIERLKQIKSIYVMSVFSHLASSEDPDDDDFTRFQIDQFEKMAARIKEHSDHYIMMHILNSAGIHRFPNAQFDMVRLGISLYGIQTTGYDQPNLENVSTLKSTISQIKNIKAKLRMFLLMLQLMQ